MLKLSLREIFLVLACGGLVLVIAIPKSPKRPPLPLAELLEAFFQIQPHFDTYCLECTPPMEIVTFENSGGYVNSQTARHILAEHVSGFNAGSHKIEDVVSGFRSTVRSHMEAHGFTIRDHVSTPEFDHEFQCYVEHDGGYAVLIFRVQTSAQNPTMISRMFAWADE